MESMVTVKFELGERERERVREVLRFNDISYAHSFVQNDNYNNDTIAYQMPMSNIFIPLAFLLIVIEKESDR